MRAGEGEGRALHLERLLVFGAVGGVFADPHLASAVQADDRGAARELRRDLNAQPLELVGVDLDRQVGNE